MRIPRHLLLLVLIFGISVCAFGQAEEVPVYHPVYTFLKRMEVQGKIERFHDAILPLSRKDVGRFLLALKELEATLTDAERGFLEDYLFEFQFDITGSLSSFHTLIESEDSTFGNALANTFSNKEKYLYAFADSTLSFFVNGLVTLDARRITGDALAKEHSEYFQFGGRIRGTIYNKLGYYLQGTNAQFWGSRELLERDKFIGQTTTVYVGDARNFDMSEGFVRYDGGMISAGIGTERLLWGNGYAQKMIVSDLVRPFPFLRLDAEYKSLKYTFIHGWLLGTSGQLVFHLPSDTSAYYIEPTNADKYIAAHRIEFSFPGLFDIGGQEMVIYSNRSVDLAYLTPVIVLESAQRARGERDNTLWAFDIQTHFIAGLELSGTLLMDDIHFADFFKPRYFNKNAYQLGLCLTDPLFLPNATLKVQWTRVEPFTYGHDRSRDNTYSSLGALLGSDIGPNADNWYLSAGYYPLRNLSVEVNVTLVRHGENYRDSLGQLVNVGGDFLQPHRSTDPLDREFMAGRVVKSSTVEVMATYEIRNQIWIDAWLTAERLRNTFFDTETSNNTVGARLRMEF